MTDPTDWLEDFTIDLSEDSISIMVSDVAETLVYTGSRPAAAVWLTGAGILGGALGGGLVSPGLWRSVLSLLAYVFVLPAAWQTMRLGTMRFFGPAIRWQAVLVFFWTFLLAAGAVAGAQISSTWLAYTVSIGAGLFIGLVCGSLDPSSIRNADAWLLTGLPLGAISTGVATSTARNMLADPSSVSAAALTGALAALIFSAPMMVLVVWLGDAAQGLRHLAVLHLHNDALMPKALDYLHRAIALSPGNADLYNLRGIAWSRAGDGARAAADWEKVVQLEPASAEPSMNRGVDALRRGVLDEAVDWLERAIQIDAKHVQAHTNMGVALERRGELERAITHYDRAIRLAPKNPRLYSNRAYARFRAGDDQRAVEDCDHALDLEPDLPMAYVNRGHALAALGEHDRAADDYR